MPAMCSNIQIATAWVPMTITFPVFEWRLKAACIRPVNTIARPMYAYASIGISDMSAPLDQPFSLLCQGPMSKGSMVGWIGDLLLEPGQAMWITLCSDTVTPFVFGITTEAICSTVPDDTGKEHPSDKC